MTPDFTSPPTENPSIEPPVSKPTSSVVNMAIWDFAGRIASFGVVFVVSVMLTRLLEPGEFGTYAITLAIISFSAIFIDLGLRIAIVQAQEVTQQQLSTIFYLNLAAALGLFGLFLFTAGSIESFYEIDGLQNYIIAASGLFIVNSLALIPSALLQKRLQFKTMSLVSSTTAAISGGLAIYLAFSGFGVWALVAQQLISAMLMLIGVSIFAEWRPSISFNLSSIKDLWQYGMRMFASGLSNMIFSRLDVFIIGKLFPIQTLGFYNRAQGLDTLVKGFGAGTTISVAFPVIATMANDLERIRTFYRRCLNIIAFLTFLLIGILFLTCFDIVIILFTDKWETVGSYFRIMAATGFVYPISALMVNVISARGNAKAFLKLELIKQSIVFPIYLTFFFGGVYLFLIVLGTASIGGLVLNAVYLKKEILVDVSEQLWTVGKYGMTGLAGVAVVYGVTFYLDNVYSHLMAASVLYGTLYIFICNKLRLSGFFEIYERLITFYHDKRHTNISPAA